MQLPPLSRRLALTLCLVVLANGEVGVRAARAAGSSVTAFTTKTQTANVGDTVTFEVGVTSTDGNVWAPATVGLAIALSAADGTVAQTSSPVAPADEVDPGRTTVVFITMQLQTSLGGTYQARALVTHAGNLVDTSDPLPVLVGVTVAQAVGSTAQASGTAAQTPVLAPALPPALSPAPGASGAPAPAASAAAVPPPATVVQAPPAPAATRPPLFTATVDGTNNLSVPSSQQGDLDIHYKTSATSSLETKGGLSSTSGTAPPLLTFTTLGSMTQFGTTSIAFDDGVLSGPSGVGIQTKFQWGTLHSLQIGFLAGGDATPNPFDLYGLQYSMPIGAGSLSYSTGYVNQDGPVQTGGPDFLVRGDLFGLEYKHPANAAGFSYQMRYGLIDYLDGIAGVWRDDRAWDVQTGFRFARWDWVADYNRAGPFYPTLTASGVSPDREDESISGSHTYGPLKISIKVDDNRTALNGSPGVQTGHVLNETLGLNYTFHSKDTLEFDVSNAINHVLADAPVASLNDNLSLAYSGTRGKTQFQLSVASATSQDNSGTTAHTITDTAQVTRTINSLLSIAGTYTDTDSLGNTSAATNIGQQAGITMNYNLALWTISSGYNWSLTKPYTGLATPSTTGLNLGLVFKPKFTPTTIQAAVTRTNGPSPSTVGRLNFSRQY